ncbi:unnamed protein product [Heterobilharzia americana]|nr:unnamed protein product [Heterobilharzia americana]
MSTTHHSLHSSGASAPHSTISYFRPCIFGIVGAITIRFFRRFVLRSMCTVLGFVVSIDSDLRTDHNTCMPLVSNHVTLFDHLMMCLSEDCITPNTHVFHWKSISQSKEKAYSVSEFIFRCARDNHQPVHLLPERSPTGFTDCLFKFDHNMFTSIDRVQPVALKVHRIFPIKLVAHPISRTTELLWQLFTPSHITISNFCERVRSAIGRSLGATLSPMSAEHLVDYSGTESQISSISFANLRSSAVSSQSVTPRSSSLSRKHSTSSSTDTFVSSNLLTSDGIRFRQTVQLNHEVRGTLSDFAFEHLVPRINEILSDIPVNRIREALVNTHGDVESAISLLLENSNESSSQQDVHHFTENKSILSPSRLNVAASQFLPNSNGRQLSLSERREALLSHARQLFLTRQQQSA